MGPGPDQGAVGMPRSNYAYVLDFLTQEFLK